MSFLWGGEGKKGAEDFWLRNSRAGVPCLDILADRGGRFHLCLQPSMEPGTETVERPCSLLPWLRHVCEREEQSHLWFRLLVCPFADFLAVLVCTLVSHPSIFKLLLLS